MNATKFKISVVESKKFSNWHSNDIKQHFLTHLAVKVYGNVNYKYNEVYDMSIIQTINIKTPPM